jgi:hypothetical protein
VKLPEATRVVDVLGGTGQDLGNHQILPDRSAARGRPRLMSRARSRNARRAKTTPLPCFYVHVRMHRGDKVLPRLTSGFVDRLLGRAVDHDDEGARP